MDFLEGRNVENEKMWKFDERMKNKCVRQNSLFEENLVYDIYFAAFGIGIPRTRDLSGRHCEERSNL